MATFLRDSQHGGRAASKDATARALSALYQKTPSSEERYRGIFQKARVALWDEDFSPVLKMLDRLRAEGVCDLRSFFDEHPKQLIEAIDLVRLNDVNDYTVEMFEAERKDDLLRSLASVFVPESEVIFLEELMTLWEGRRSFESEMALRTLKGRRLDVIFSVAYEGTCCEQTLVSIVDISARKAAEAKAKRLASIVEHSEDAIYSIDLDGNITSWNRGAERLFGYVPEEVIGRSVNLLIPQDHHDEEQRIQARIRRGESIEFYETLRQCKDGGLLDISLSVSPIRSADGALIGAAKIGRDITQRKRAHEQQRLLVNEMKHRIKNTLATVQAIAMQTFHQSNPEEREVFTSRLLALSSAHDLLTREQWDRTSLQEIVTGALRPFLDNYREQFALDGCPAVVESSNALLLTMAIHELATNAIKYGALSNGRGRVHVTWRVHDASQGACIKLCWQERDGPAVGTPVRQGFGSRLIENAFRCETGGCFEFTPEGLVCSLSIPSASVDN